MNMSLKNNEDSPWQAIWRSLATIFKFYGNRAEIASVVVLATLSDVPDSEYNSLRADLIAAVSQDARETQEHLMMITDALRDLHSKMPQAEQYTRYFCDILIKAQKGGAVDQSTTLH